MENGYVETSGRSVEEATEKALKQLGATRDEVEVSVIKKGRSGILGLGTEEAVVGVQRVVRAPINLEAQEQAKPRADAADAAEVAATVIQDLLQLLRLEATVRKLEPASPDQPLSFDIKGDDLGLLIGRRGQTLADFQFIVRLIVAHKLQSWIPLTIDAEGYKKKRLESLTVLALRMADQVKATRRAITMEPMPPDERRAIHLALADSPDVTTQSFGEGDARKVSIILKKS